MSYRIILAAAAVAVSATPAFTQSAFAQSASDKAADAAIACLDITDAGERLACLETATQEIKATRIRRESAEESAAAEAAGAVAYDEGASEEDQFGAEALASTRHARNEKRKTQKLQADVVEFRVNSLGVLTAVLDNGQVWRQLSADDERIILPKKDRKLTVTVKKGMVGNYRMTINELKRTIRVRRIK